uniref:G-protein coupled receptors family 1 profile domain-containing protein n=1 Tax=Pygocentrus nattereri TaxID=42514 RepID=A0A3B4DQC7_PYGNA
MMALSSFSSYFSSAYATTHSCRQKFEQLRSNDVLVILKERTSDHIVYRKQLEHGRANFCVQLLISFTTNRLSTIFLKHLAASDLVFILTLDGVSRSFIMVALDFTCRFSTYLFYISMYCSILFLTALSLCRYLVLAGRVRLQNSEACRWARILCWGIWVFVLGGNMLYIAATFGFNIRAEGCLEPRGESWGWLYQLNLIVLVICFLLPLTVVLICYSLMIRHILRTRSGQRQRDVALVCLVLCIFCLCFLPYHIQRTLHLYYIMHHQKDCQLLATLQKTVVVTLCFAALNSCLDPLIFLFVGHGFIPVMNKLIAQCALRGQSHQGGVSSALSFTSPPAVRLPLIRGQNNVEIEPASPVILRFSQKMDTTD